jgi:transcriptional regulator with XRE-family HTH domain
VAIRSPEHVAFGQAIRAVRRRQGVSQEGLALKCGLDRTYVSGIERGVRNPSLANILKLAAALDVIPADLLAGIGQDARAANGPSGLSDQSPAAP